MSFGFYKEVSFKGTPIGKIPKDWELVKLSDIAEDIYYGITAKAVENKTGLKMLRTTDIKDYIVDWDSLPFCEVTEKRGDIQRFLLKKGDLIIARAGTTGISVLVEKDFENVIFGSYLIKVRLSRKVHPKFMRYFCQSRLYWDHITSSQAGSTLKNISLPVLRSLNVPLPSSIEEQQKIAEILSTVDEAIHKTNEIIAKTERLKKGLMQELLSKGLILGFMFDTNVFNAILNEHIDLERLPRNLKYYVTHIQYDEICSTQSEARKGELLKIIEKVPSEVIATEGAVYGVSKYGMAKYMSETDAKQYDEMLRRLKELDEKAGKRKPLENQARDVLIALTSIKNCLILVTEDKNLKRVTEEFNGQAITFEQLQRGEYKEYKNTEIGRIPKNWKIVELSEVAEINRESIDPTKEIPNETFIYIDIDSIEGGTGKIRNYKRILGMDAPSRARRVIHENDILMSTVRPYLKAFAIVPKEYDNQICSTGFAVLTCKNSILPYFLLNVLFSDNVIAQCNRMMVGGQYPALNQAQVSRIKISLPPLREQQKIVEILSTIDKKLEVEKNEKAKLERIKQGLMDLLLTGKIRVKVS
jgi:restriction endonuclease S subunit